jgi:hypothetical protein
MKNIINNPSALMQCADKKPANSKYRLQNYPDGIQTNDPSLEGVENYPRIKG